MTDNCGIYQLVFPNGKTYIGSSKNIRSRVAGHLRKMADKRHVNKKLSGAFHKYGTPEPRLIIACRVSDLLLYEQIALDALRPEYNLTPKAGSVVLSEAGRLRLGEKSRAAWSRNRVKYEEIIAKRSVDPIYLQKIREAVARREANPLRPERLRAGIKKREQNESYVEKRRERLSRPKDQAARDHHRAQIKLRSADPAWLAKMAEVADRNRENEALHAPRGPLPIETRKKIAEAARARFRDPDKRAKFMESIARRSERPEWQASMRERNQRIAADPQIRERQTAAQRRRREMERQGG